MAAKLLACVRGCCFCLLRLSNCFCVREMFSVHHIQSLYHKEKELICCWCARLREAFPPVSGDAGDFFTLTLAALLPKKVVKPTFIQVVDVSLKPL